MSDRPDPELEAAIRFARQASRRRFLARGGAGLAGLVFAPSLLAACEDGDDGSGASGGNGDKELIFSNWEAYIDETDDGKPDGPGTTIADFEQATGIDMTYRKDYNDNDEYFTKIFEPNLGRGKRIEPDIVAPTFWMAARIIGLGYVEPLPIEDIPNHQYLETSYLALDWNPGATHHMPWQAGITGIAWNPELVGGDLTGVEDLFDPRLKGKVGMLTEMRDTLGLIMLANGADPSRSEFKDVSAALSKVDKAKADGQILKFTGNEYLDSLESGEFAACFAWSGDIAQLDPELGIKFAIPEEGGMQWFDTMVIPKGSRNRKAAARWMNYVYDPQNAAKITEWVQFITPVKGVREILIDKGGEAADLAFNPLVFPDGATTARIKTFGGLSEADDLELQDRFNEIVR